MDFKSGTESGTFKRHYETLCTLTPTDHQSCKAEMNLLLDELISESCNMTTDNTMPDDVCRLLLKVSQMVPLSQEHLVLKLCQLINQLFNQLQITLDDVTLNELVSYFIQALQTCCLWTHTEILDTLSTLLYGNGSSCQGHFPTLLGDKGILSVYSVSSQPDLELRCAAIKCMVNICMGPPGLLHLHECYLDTCFQTFLQTLQTPPSSKSDNLVFCTLLQGALKGMQCLLNGCKWRAGYDGSELGWLLAALKRLMFHGLLGTCEEMPKILYPTPLPQYDVPLAKVSEDSAPRKQEDSKPKKHGGSSRKKEFKCKRGVTKGSGDDAEDLNSQRRAGPVRKTQACHDSKWPQGACADSFSGSRMYSYDPHWGEGSSESEFSDTEGGVSGKLRLYQMRVRQASLHCFLSLVKSVDKRVLFGYWTAFIPTAPPAGRSPCLTLLTVTLRDPSPRVRAGALQLLSVLLEGSRLFLSAAEDKNSSSHRQAFTSFSETLACSLRELHGGLLQALMTESSCQTLTQVIKCLAHLVATTPYQRLQPGLLSPIWTHVQQYVQHRDVNVRVSSLTLLGALLSARAPLPEIHRLLQQHVKKPSIADPPGYSSDKSSSGNWRQQGPVEGRHWLSGDEGLCWVLRLCVCLVTQPRDNGCGSMPLLPNPVEPTPIRLEALQVLAHLVKGYFGLAQCCLLDLYQVSACCLREQDPSVQLHGTKLLEELGAAIVQQHKMVDKLPEEEQPVAFCTVVQFWCEVLTGPLTKALQNENHPTLQTSACDTLSSILPQAFKELPERTQMLCMTMLLGLTHSENSLVKAASVRALGVYILFPGISEDLMFLTDSADVLMLALKDHSPNVRTKAAWSFANLTDTILDNMKSTSIDMKEELSSGLCMKLMKSSIDAAKDKDRVKSNAVRALGNLLHLLQPEQLKQAEYGLLLEQGVAILVDTVEGGDTSMKVRWNACYALGNAFQNTDLPLGTAKWSAQAYAALSAAMVTCKNFKVRIKSAAALSTPSSRQQYGNKEEFGKLWGAVIQALEHTKDDTDFNEYRYRASLCGQLCQTLLHFLNVCDAQDLPMIHTAIVVGLHGTTPAEFLASYLTDDSSGMEEEESTKRDQHPDRLREVMGVIESLRKLEDEEEGSQLASDIRSCLEQLLRPQHKD